MIDKRKLIFLFCVIITILIFYIDKIRYGTRKIVTTHPQYMMNKHILDCNTYNFYGVNKGISSSISFWLYVKDWNYKVMEYKPIIKKGDLEIYMPPKNNFIVIDIPIVGSRKKDTISFKTIPLQKWINVALIIENRHADLWINGKLYISKHLTNLPDLKNNKKVICADMNGFDGYISRITTWTYVISKSIIERVFKTGPVDKSFLTKLKGIFNKILNKLQRDKIQCER